MLRTSRSEFLSEIKTEFAYNFHVLLLESLNFIFVVLLTADVPRVQGVLQQSLIYFKYIIIILIII